MMTNEDLSAHLRAEVGRQQVTRTDLAEKIGVSRKSVHELLNGDTRIVNENALALLDLLGLELTVREKAKSND